MSSLAPHQLLMLLQWTDSAFPTGAFAHSGGLETYIQHGVIRNGRDLQRFIETKLESAAYTDFIVIHTAMRAYDRHDWTMLQELDVLCSASKPARETREASEKIGRRMLSSVLNVYPDERLTTYRAHLEQKIMIGHHAVVQGLACAALGIEPIAALSAFAYGLASNQTAASVKLMSIGQTQAQAVLAACGEAITRAVDTALSLTLEDFGCFTQGLDIRAMHHEHLFRRLFIS